MGNFVGCKSERLTGVTPRYRIKKIKSHKKLIKKVELRNMPYCIHQTINRIASTMFIKNKNFKLCMGI